MSTPSIILLHYFFAQTKCNYALQALVVWFGKGSTIKETMLAVNTLLTLTEGLDEHHKNRKRIRQAR